MWVNQSVARMEMVPFHLIEWKITMEEMMPQKTELVTSLSQDDFALLLRTKKEQMGENCFFSFVSKLDNSCWTQLVAVERVFEEDLISKELGIAHRVHELDPKYDKCGSLSF